MTSNPNPCSNITKEHEWKGRFERWQNITSFFQIIYFQGKSGFLDSFKLLKVTITRKLSEMPAKGCDKFTRTWIIQFIPTHIYIDRNKKITPIVDMQIWICKFKKYPLSMLESMYHFIYRLPYSVLRYMRWNTFLILVCYTYIWFQVACNDVIHIE